PASQEVALDLETFVDFSRVFFRFWHAGGRNSGRAHRDPDRGCDLVGLCPAAYHRPTDRSRGCCHQPMSERIASATTERGEVTLRRVEDACGRDALELRVGGAFVMDTAITSTERRLASAALQRCASPQRVLVGGLGLGFTTAEVLTDERVQQVQVVEIEQPVIDWLGQGMVPGGPELLADPRLEVVCADVLDHIAAAPQRSVDLVLMDVDNGPGQLVHA